jgi:hypothetical protein
MPDSAASIAFDPSAPSSEQTAALSELQKGSAPSALSDLLPQDAVREVIDFINADYEDQAFRKSINPNIVPFPSKRAKEGEPGMQSVRLDDWQLSINGDFWERPSALGFDSLRAMVEQTPILNAVVFTRVRQVQRFCRIAEDNNETPGFEIKHIDKSHQLDASERESIQLLNRFMSNCGWEFSPRKRKALRRDSFSQFMAKVVRDTLTLDSVGVETEWKRDQALGIDGFYAVDGATIRLCTEDGYRLDDEVFALQVVQGRVTTPYTFNDLIYEPRNPRSDVRSCGYGLPETEVLVRVVTGFLNAMTYNISGFDKSAIPKGMLHLTGNYSDADINAFKRYWNAMVRGVNNQFSLPVMVSKDQESKVSFEKFGIEFDEMYFSKWMTFLTSIICAIYGMSPAEINFDSFTAGSTSALAGSDTSEKLAASKDSGLRPVLSYFENLFTDYIVGEFSDKYAFRWTGLDPADKEKKHEVRKLVLTVDEMRAEEGYEKHENPDIGNAPVNPSLAGLYMQSAGIGQQQPDFGTPSEGDDKDKDQGGDAPESDTVAPDKDSGADGAGEPNDAPDDAPAAAPEPSRGDDLDFGKAMPSVYVLGG